jgi:four helix bundle protein
LLTDVFISILLIALKECYETEYWCELLINGGCHNNTEIQENYIGIKKILIASVNTSKEDM